MMSDLVKPDLANNDVACDLQFVEGPRELLDDLVDYEFNPCGFFYSKPGGTDRVRCRPASCEDPASASERS